MTFGDDESPTSSVSFDQAGTYVLGLEAGGEVDEVTITVEGVQGYAQWIAGYPAIDSDPLADPDFDGVKNLLEFATGGDPENGGNQGASTLIEDAANPGELLFSYRRLREVTAGDGNGATGNGYSIYGINYTVQASEDMSAWNTAAVSLSMTVEGTPVDHGDGTELVTVRLYPPVLSDQRWFVRLRVVQE